MSTPFCKKHEKYFILAALTLCRQRQKGVCTKCVKDKTLTARALRRQRRRATLPKGDKSVKSRAPHQASSHTPYGQPPQKEKERKEQCVTGKKARCLPPQKGKAVRWAKPFQKCILKFAFSFGIINLRDIARTLHKRRFFAFLKDVLRLMPYGLRRRKSKHVGRQD